jgi:8-oxo-dGTP diphosphatase
VLFAPALDWSYTTFVVRVDVPFGASINFETDDVAWLPLDDVDRLPLHAGFASAWPELKEIARRAA